MARFIATGDWHLREDRPRCRKDESWIQSQWFHVSQVAEIANKKDCPIIITGDIFNKATAPQIVINLFLQFVSRLKNPVTFIAGNHDLPYHSMNNVADSAIGILFSSAKLHSPKIASISSIFPEVSYQNFGETIEGSDSSKILILHTLVFEDSSSIPPNVNANTAEGLLKEYPQYTWIITGDCHNSFHYISEDNRHVINPGHLNIQKIDEIKNPLVYYVDTDKGIVEPIEIKDNVELVTDEYIREEEEREDRIEAFIEKLQGNDNITLSFTDNIEKAIRQNSLKEETVKMITYLMEEVK